MSYTKPEHKKVVSLHVKLTKSQREWVSKQAAALDMNESEFERHLHDQAMRMPSSGNGPAWGKVEGQGQ